VLGEPVIESWRSGLFPICKHVDWLNVGGGVE